MDKHYTLNYLVVVYNLPKSKGVDIMKKFIKFIKRINTKIDNYLFNKRIEKMLKNGPKYTYSQIIYK